ncbi:helix-turn-helix domain-containing protein [Paenibacillus sp. 19GGS1-52]|uniref:helix-turn-helix domain-containing protein n=1 Tax=Paenibacillus sp. 19GGS1-52 TaxID=2758563 RepID=UPI001EFA3736|nr:helix-turn-helix transcriptional regulator [Paenibacillus sp. 19GGS1-52]ULO05169.1 helix-turn-helix domain-containing protein [Paenibacillus sp. 19GGS1-52]
MKPKVFGEYLRKLRNDKKLTLEQVAKSAGFSKGYLSNIENGRRGVPSPEILKKLAVALETQYMELMQAAGHVPEAELDMLIDMSKQVANEAYSKSVVSEKYIEGFIDQLNSYQNYKDKIDNPDTTQDEKKIAIVSMQQIIDNILNATKRMDRRLKQETSKPVDDSDDPDVLDGLSKKFSGSQYLKLKEAQGQINLPPIGDSRDLIMGVINRALPHIYYSSDTHQGFIGAIEEEIVDFLFEEAPDIRKKIVLTPEGIKDFVDTHYFEHQESLWKLSICLEQISDRFKALAFDHPELSDVGIDLKVWLDKGVLHYGQHLINDQQRQLILAYLDALIPNVNKPKS